VLATGRRRREPGRLTQSKSICGSNRAEDHVSRIRELAHLDQRVVGPEGLRSAPHHMACTLVRTKHGLLR
jgi:hypothetical protein